jgi:DNA-binding transcriptional LysR family regulator
VPAYPDHVRSVAVEIKGAVSADSSDVLLRLAVEGVGIVRLGELAVGRALRNGSLEPLCWAHR